MNANLMPVSPAARRFFVLVVVLLAALLAAPAATAASLNDSNGDNYTIPVEPDPGWEAYSPITISGAPAGSVIDSIVVLAITYVAGVATPLGALLAGVFAAGGLLTVGLEELSPGSTEVQMAVNGIMLIVVAIRFPSVVLGARRRR